VDAGCRPSPIKGGVLPLAPLIDRHLRQTCRWCPALELPYKQSPSFLLCLPWVPDEARWRD